MAALVASLSLAVTAADDRQPDEVPSQDRDAARLAPVAAAPPAVPADGDSFGWGSRGGLIMTIRGARDARVAPAAGDWAFAWGPWQEGGWTDVLALPSESSARVAQALLGDTVEVDEIRSGWAEVRESDGAWHGWVRAEHLTRGSDFVRRRSKELGAVYVAVGPYLELDGEGRGVPLGAHLPVAQEVGPSLDLLLPDGRLMTVARNDVASPTDPEPIMLAVKRIAGSLRKRPLFQVGGNTSEALDGPGLIFLLLRASGVAAPRDLSRLRELATHVRPDETGPGDVLLFGQFGDQEAHPAVVVDDQSLLDASPGSGLDYQVRAQMQRRPILAALRFENLLELPERIGEGFGGGAGGGRESRSAKVIPCLLLLTLLQQTFLLVALFLSWLVSKPHILPAPTADRPRPSAEGPETHANSK